MPAALSIDARVVGYKLGLGDLQQPDEICHGYRCACLCTSCLERAEAVAEMQASGGWDRWKHVPLETALPAPRSPAQPWEIDAA